MKRKLAAILAADAVSYSRLMSEDEEGTLQILAGHRAVIDGIIAAHSGRIFGTAGDSVLAEFASPVEALRSAVAIQDAPRTRNDALPETQRLRFRIGVNLGDVVEKDGDLLGDGVNVAARLEGIAEPDGICLSSAVYEQITGKLDLGFVELGEQHLKNIQRPIRVYRVSRETVGVVRGAGKRGGRTWIGVGAAVAAATFGVVAWQAWRQPVPEPAAPPAASVPAVPPAPDHTAELGARMEAEIARARADAQARADAEIAKVRAEAELAKARAEAEALRRQAAADGGEAKTQRSEELARAREAVQKAEAEAAQAKARLEAEIARARAEREAARGLAEKTAPEPAGKPVPTTSAGSGWVAERSCEAYEDRAAFFAKRVPVTMSGDEFILEEGTPGQPGFSSVRGKPAPDGSLTLTGYSIGAAASVRGQRGVASFSGRFEGDRYEAQGRLGRRLCTLTMTRARAEAGAPKVAVAEKAALGRARQPVPVPAPLGGWVAERSCEAFEGQPVLNDRVPVTIIGDEFVLEKGTPGQPGYNSVRGKPAPDGWLALTGYAIGLAGALRGQRGFASFSGRFDGHRYEAQGLLGRRACTLTIYRQP